MIYDLEQFPFHLVCPACHGTLSTTEKQLQCTACKHSYPVDNGFPDLIIGDKFEDESDDVCLCYEEESNQYTASQFWLPLFRKYQQLVDRPLNILTVGCGTGVEVDILCSAGFNCVGIDNGNRTRVWPNRTHSNRFLLANGMKLPFNDGSFDVVFCGCVFPHVGVIGDSVYVSENYLTDRESLASEMARVTTSGGHIVVSSPNRHFPFDIFHGRQPGSYTPRFNRPGERFLLTARDYAEMFSHCGCSNLSAQPTLGYWGFVRSKKSLKGMIFSMPFRFIFWLTSLSSFAWLRTSLISPWLVLTTKKNP
jgi:SAM-dependent methyltransferase